VRRTGALLAVLLTLLALPAAASAAPQWFAPQAISPFGWTVGNVDIDPAGNAVAILSGPNGLATTTRPVGGAFGPPEGIPFVVGDGGGMVATDDHGGAVVAWQEGAEPRLMTTTRPAGGAWSPPVEAGRPDFNSGYWQLVVGPDGTTAVIWNNGGSFRVAVRPPGGSFGAPQDVGPIAGHIELDPPQAVIDGSGRLFVFFTSTGRNSQTAEYAEKPPGLSFLPTKVAMENVGPMPGVAAVSEGGALAYFAMRDVPNTPDVYLDYESAIAVREIGESEFGEAATVSANGAYGDVAVADDGSALALWPEGPQNGRLSWLNATLRSADGTIGPPQTISAKTGVVSSPEVGIDAGGDAVAIWEQGGPPTSSFPGVDPTHIEGAVRSAGGAFDAHRALSGDARYQSSSLAVAPSGTAVAVWSEAMGQGTCVKAVVRAEASLPGNAKTCAAVPAPSVPGRKRVLTLADGLPPGLKFTGSKTQKLAGPAIAVTAACTEPCVLSATGAVSVGNAARSYKLRSAKTRLLPAGRKAKLRLKLSKKTYRATRKALKHHRKVTVAIKVTAKDRRGNRKTFKRKLRLKARR
jgi:hypothetical protein